ncbi:NTE family protein [Frondihabitans sp. PhB188]|uniref:patatin-like phospholipase family protein n=1 Tax=Frondihabitans sp. PhB188 TaxID=2485200 RepID=UPI000F48CFB0|nr:patatin-like phospholipase family protein [Frondihabitans sp. PhB188]ROQ40772.1 NTE family protein [Frondihabitans sp. PhB188]
MTDTPSSSPRRALVLGGGGIAGIAWHLGVLTELLAVDVDVDHADLVVGTSAGSVAGSILRFGMAPAVFAAQAAAGSAVTTPPEGVDAPGADMSDFGQQVMDVVAGATSQQEARAKLGQAAIAFARGAESPLLAQLGSQFPDAFGWPPAPLRVCVVRADTGEFEVLDSSSGVPLARAVAASCSVPLVFPPVEIGGHPYVDGGACSATNADVADGFDRVLVLSCGTEDPANPLGPQLDEAVAGLRAAGADVMVITADEASLKAFGGNSLDDSSRIPSALAGRTQAAGIAGEVAAFWS